MTAHTDLIVSHYCCGGNVMRLLIILLLASTCFGGTVAATDPDADDTLTLEIDEPVVTQTEDGVRYEWPARVVDSHGASDSGIVLVAHDYLVGDLNRDGCVDMQDLAIFADNWLQEI